MVFEDALGVPYRTPHQTLKKIEIKITLDKNKTIVPNKKNFDNNTTHNQISPQKNNVHGNSKKNNKLHNVKYAVVGDVYHKPVTLNI
jgi:hypothetical protein